MAMLLPGSLLASRSRVKSAIRADECLDRMRKVVSQDLGCFWWPGDELVHPFCMGSASAVSGGFLRGAALC